MPISPANYSQGIDEFYTTQELEEEAQQPKHWTGLTDDAIERISEGTAPLLFDRDVDLNPTVAEFNEYLEKLKVKEKEHREKTWRFI